MGRLTTSAARPRRAHRGLGHPDATERGVDEQPVSGDSVGHAPGIVVKQIGDHDLVIVVGRVCERAATVAVAYGPDPLDVGLKLVIDDDIPSVVQYQACRIDTEVVGVRCSPDSQ